MKATFSPMRRFRTGIPPEHSTTRAPFDYNEQSLLDLLTLPCPGHDVLPLLAVSASNLMVS